MTPEQHTRRQRLLGIVSFALVGTLFVRLWYLQVLENDRYEAEVAATNVRTVVTEAPRGRILDRDGTPLVENERVIQIEVDYQAFHDLAAPDQNELLRRLASELNRDAVLRAAGQRAPNDPGPRPDPTETTLPVPTSGPGEVPAENPPVGGESEAQRPPPAGVAIGDGSTADGGAAPITPEELSERIEDPRYSKDRPVPIETAISEDLQILLTERAQEFPSVRATRVTARAYRYGALLAHVLGYVGPVSEEDLELFESPQKPYEPDHSAGKAGIERTLERDLRGVPGVKVYEVDARGRRVREVVERRREPVPGDDVYLTIDIDLQYLVEVGLAAEVERRRRADAADCGADGCDPPGAAAVAIDPRDGQVLAMASYPTFDPSLFTGGISSADYEAIASPERAEEHRNPLTNRAIGGQYAPGSTFKLFSSYAALATSLVTPEYVYQDTGVYYFSQPCSSSLCRKQNAGMDAKGAVDLARALTVSSDTYFYRLGHESWLRKDQLGEDGLQRQMEVWGLGEQTGIDLPGEAAGRIPTPAWQRTFAESLYDDPADQEEYGRWLAGTSANTAIGQGDVLTTPLQLANGYATFANGGTTWRPQLVLQVSPFGTQTARRVLEPEKTGQVPFAPGWREAILTGLDQVTKPGTGGTASATFQGFDQSACAVAGKTGTAQATDKDDSSLFVAFAPSTAPRIAISAIFEQAGFGSSAAVPFVRRVLEPLAAAGCDVAALGGEGSPTQAPLGGWVDVDAAIEAFQPPVAAQAD